MIKGKILYRQFLWEEYQKGNISEKDAVARIEEYEEQKGIHMKGCTILTENFT